MPVPPLPGVSLGRGGMSPGFVSGDYQKSLEEGSRHPSKKPVALYEGEGDASQRTTFGERQEEEEEEEKRKRNLPSRFVGGLLAVAGGMAHAASHTAKSVMWGGGGKRGGGRARGPRRSKKSRRARSSRDKTLDGGGVLLSSRLVAGGSRGGVRGETESRTRIVTSYDQEACTFYPEEEEDDDDDGQPEEDVDEELSSSSSTEEEEDQQISSSSWKQHEEIGYPYLGRDGAQCILEGRELRPVSHHSSCPEQKDFLSGFGPSSTVCPPSEMASASPPAPSLALSAPPLSHTPFLDDLYGQPYHRGKKTSSSSSTSLEERRREKAFLTRLRDLSVAERVVIIWGRMLLSCRATRLFALFYFLVLHLLVFFVLFHHADLASRSASYSSTSSLLQHTGGGAGEAGGGRHGSGGAPPLLQNNISSPHYHYYLNE